MGIGRLEVLQQSVVRRAWDRGADRTDELFLVVSCYQVPHNISIKMAAPGYPRAVARAVVSGQPVITWTLHLSAAIRAPSLNPQ